MNQERLMTVLLGPHVSEKGHAAADRNNQMVFRVRRDANKAEIRQAVELMFEVKVEGVQVINCKGKSKRFGRHTGTRGTLRKAYVSLKAGQEINFLQEAG